jgi:hypothetical protein
METIFITIPAYEDPYLIRTLDSAISKAFAPERIRFAIALQYKNNPMPDISGYNADAIIYDVDNRPSVHRIRHNLLKMYDGEDYYMMIDSHMLFMQDWDRLLIEDYKNLQTLAHNKVIISKQVGTYCGDMPPNTLNEKSIWKIVPPADGEAFSDPGYFSCHLKGWIEPFPVNTEYFITHYSSSHFFFVQGSYVDEVGILDLSSIRSEEQLISYRSFMYGWDIYAVNNRNHVAHMDADYRMSVFGTMRPKKKDIYKYTADESSILREIDNLFINNTGKFAIENPKRLPKDFYFSIGLLDAWEQFCYTR